ncbi:TetR/AcrR family transcriptional regulator [Streptomyces sp. NPDC053431]|uniref:TetR/AcrR family transcriptional regulator n=1 Tax=Streptomyces sp. NPDC053431 TaxID=3365703 RepID=UPI0037CE8145
MTADPPSPETGLRERLVRTGVELVDAQGVQALSLREIARRAGVSHGAPRRHFPTHLDLLSAIAREGFHELGARVAAVSEDEPRARIAALARIYLDFAHTRGGMYELMFRHDLLESGRLGLRDTSLPLFAHLAELVARARPDAADPALTAGALWANLHGLAQLRRWGSLRLATGTDDVAPLLDAALDAHLGPAARPGARSEAGPEVGPDAGPGAGTAGGGR